MKRLLKLGLLVGGIAAVVKLVGAKRADWEGLTEAQVREKLGARLPDRMPAEKQAAVADKIVEKLRYRGVLREEAAPPEPEGNGGPTATKVAEASGEEEESGSEESESS